MKKIIFMATAICLIYLFAGCSDDNGLETNGSSGNEENNISENTGYVIEESIAEEIQAPSYTSNMTDRTWMSANMEHSRFNRIDDFLDAADDYIAAISEFTGRENWFDEYARGNVRPHIEYMLTNQISHMRINHPRIDLYLNQEFFEHDLAPIAYMLTLIIVPYNGSASLRNGLASYCQNKFGNNPSVFNWGINPHVFLNLLLNNANDLAMEIFEQVFDVIGTADERQHEYAEGDMRQFFNIASHSFVTYLIDGFGIENFMNLYWSDNLIRDYYEIYGKSFEDIKSGWIEFLESYPEVMTVEEYFNYMTELHARHNLIVP